MTLQTPILLRSGKIQTEFSERVNKWSVSIGGWTDQFKERIPAEKFSANLVGYNFSRNTVIGTTVFDKAGIYQAPHLYLREISIYTNATFEVIEHDLWLCSEGGYFYCDTIDELRSTALSLLNSASGVNCTYSLDEDGDLIFEQKDTSSFPRTSVQICGPIAFALGWGYMQKAKEENFIAQHIDNSASLAMVNRAVQGDNAFQYWDTMTRSVNNQTIGGMNLAHPYVMRVAEKGNTNVLEGVCYEVPTGASYSGTEYPTGSGYYWTVDTTPIELVKNPSQCVYLYMQDMSEYEVQEVPNCYWKIPFNTAETVRALHIARDNDTTFFPTGQSLSIGKPGNKRFFTCDCDSLTGSTGASQYFTADFVDDSSVTKSDSIGRNNYSFFSVGPMPMTLYWCGFLREDDPYLITDGANPHSKTASKIFKTLLGIRTGALSSIGDRRKITTVKDLFGDDENSDRELIDWDAFDECSNAAGSDVALFSLNLNGDEKEYMFYDLLLATCTTLGIKMCYEYRESQRAKVLTFKPFVGESAAIIAAQNKFVEESHLIADDTPSGTVGGQWLYSGVAPSIKNAKGEDVNISVVQRQGVTSAKMYEYTDHITKLNANGTPTDFVNRLYDYVMEWSQPSWTQELACTIAPFALLSVGSGCLYSGSFILDRFTGARGVTNRVGDLISMRETWGSNGARLDLEVRITGRPRKGIAPSADIDASKVSIAGSTVTIAAGGFVDDYTDNVYQSPNIPLTDLAYFGCWMYNKGTDALEQRSCGCGNYAIVIFPNDVSTLIDSGVDQNVWHGRITQPTAANLTNGTGTITLDSTTNFSAWITTLTASGGTFGIDFELSSDADLQPCQLDYYGWLGDSSGEITLAGGTDRAIEWY